MKAGYAVGVISGLDTNPLRIQDDGPDGFFTQLRIAGQVESALSASWGLFLSGQARGRLHESATAGADFHGATARAGLTFAPRRLSRLALAGGLAYDGHRSTYTDRATGEVYAVAAGPAAGSTEPVTIADRLDYDAAELFFNARWQQTRRLRLFVDTRAERTNYLEDYAATTTLEPLDFEALTVEPGVSLQLHPAARLTLSAAVTELDYDAQSALDHEGYRVPGETRSYHYTHYRLTARIAPAERWSLWAGARSSDRRDAYAGYYDYGSISAYVTADRRHGARGRFRAHASLSDLKYDHATVSGDPEGQTLDSQVGVFLTRYERDTTARLRWFFEAGVQRTDSRDPVFDHDSGWMLCGLEFRRGASADGG